MSRVVVYIAVSLDGFIADKDGGVDWLVEIAPLDQGDDYGYGEFYASIGSLVMGRTTYDQVLGFGEWPYPGKPTYVVSSNPPEGDHPDVEFVSGGLIPFLADLRTRTEGDIWHVGGGKLIAYFLAKGLIDEFIITFIPVLLGEGILLFPETQAPISLELVGFQTFECGLAQVKYIIS